jgi:hypothetical protein
LYQEKIDKARRDSSADTVHSERVYVFVVEYGQNMELPVYNSEQPGCTYYYSPLSVYNLGMVDHGHVCENGDVTKHMYAHIYHERVGKKGANNVALLVVKTLTQLNLLREELVGGELNIIFDNCYETDRVALSIDSNTEQLLIEQIINSVHISSMHHMENCNQRHGTLNLTLSM